MADPPHKKSKGFLSRASRARPEWSRRSLANGSSPGSAQSPTPVASGSTLSLDSQDYPQPTESLFPPSAYSSNIHSAANASAISHLGSLHHSTTSHAAASATGSAGVSEAALVSALVRRVVSRLPIHSGTSTATPEQEESVAQACISLETFARSQLAHVVLPLLAELEALTKPPFHSDSDFVSLDLLRSQLFLLALLARCLHSNWAAHDLRRRSPSSAASSSSSPPPSPGFCDPPPLDEPLARSCLSLAAIFLKTHTVQDDEFSPLNAGLAKDGLAGANTSVSFLSQAALRTEAASQRTPRSPKTAGPSWESLNSSSTGGPVRTRQQAAAEIVQHAAGVVYFLSASNWPVVISRFKSRVLHHKGGSDDLPDSSEMRILECCCLDRRRLSIVIQELCNTFIHLKRPSQATMSIVLHRALWSFLESFGGEFAALTSAGRRLEGGPEVLFDIIYTLSESSKKKDFAWPVMAMLLLCCPDIVGKLVVGEGARSPGLTKKVQFIDLLRKALKGKLADVAAVCYADLARAATYTEPDDHDPSALRLLVSDFDVELKAVLFDPQQPFLLPAGYATALNTQTLVSLYRLNPSSVIESVFALLLRSDTHEKQKAAALEAVLVLFREGQLLPWTPSPTALLSTVARPLRQLFLETAALPFSPPTPRRPSSARHLPTRSSAEHHSSNITFLINILHIWSSDLRFLVHGVFRPPTDAPPNQPGSGDTLAKVLLATVGLLEAGAPAGVRRAAMDMVGKLLGEEGEEVASARDGAGLEVATLPVSFAISRFVVEASSAEEQLAGKVLLQDVKRYQRLFSRSPSDRIANLLAQSAGWTAHWTALEIAALTLLNSVDPQARSNGFEALQRAASVLNAIARFGPKLGGDEQKTTIRLLATAANSSQSKDIGKVLGGLEHATTGLVAAWDEAMRRWKDLSGYIFDRAGTEEDDFESRSRVGHQRESSEVSRTPEQHFEEWIGLSSFLLAGSGVCVEGVGAAPLEDVLPSTRYPQRFFRRVDRAKQVDSLIQELVDLLVSDSINVRDGVRDCLGHGLSPRQLPAFVAHLDQISRHFIQNHGVPVTKEAFTVFVEQTIAVLRLVFDRERTSTAPALSDEAVSTLDGLLLSFSIYVQRMDSNLQAYRLKIRLCALCESILVQREPIQRDSVFRNKILERFVSWASDAPMQHDEGHERLQRDLDLACLKAMVPLLDGLVIHATEDGTSQRGTDTRLFNRYFDFFAFSLHRLAQSDIEDGESLRRGGQASATNPAARDAVVSSLANLLSANVETAQLQFGEMSLSPDVSARAAYLETLGKVIDKGTRFDQLPRRPVEEDTFAQLVQLLRQPGPLAIAMCHVASAAQYEDLIEVFLRVLNTRKVISRFLKAVIEMEVSFTDHESTLFRGNSFATRILTVYARARGYHYLRNTLRDLLLTLCSKPPEFSMDFDPHRQTAHDDVASRNLEQVTEAFLVCISQSIDNVPPAIREICSHIGTVVGERFPESIFTSIGGFIFLRYFNPAIVSPETIDLDLPATSASETRDFRRGLVMITKVLQALANNVRFGAKEPGLKKLNDFMDVQVFVMTRFLQAISHYNPAEEPPELLLEPVDDTSDATLDEADRTFLHQFLCDNAEKLGVELLQGRHANSRHWQEGAAPSASVGPETWSRVTELIAGLGTPPESAARAAAAAWEASPSQAYASFMARNELRTSSEAGLWDRLFYETSGNKSGHTTFCLLLHRIKAETADLESLVYFIFKTLGKVKGSYEVLVDATKFSRANEVPPLWVAQLVSIIPASTSQQLVRIILFSANSVLRRYVRKLGRSKSFENLDTRRVLAISTTAELEHYFHDVAEVLPSSTISLGREQRVQFSQITERFQVKVENPVIFKIGQRTLVLSTAKRHELFSDVRVVLDDVIDLADIEEVRKLAMGVEGEGISLKVWGEEFSRRFLANVRRDELFTELNVARSVAPTKATVVFRDRTSPPEDAMAVILNAVLINLSSSEELLRLRAYELLASLNRSFKIEGLEDLKSYEGLYVPGAHLALMSTVSERIAVAFSGSAFGVLGQVASALPVVPASDGTAYVYCLRPWLHHLQSVNFTLREERDAVQLKLRRSLRQLMRASVKEPAVHAAVLSRIWPAVGKLDFLIPLVLDEGVRMVTSFDIGSEADPCPKVGEMLLALTAGQGLRGKLLARLRRCIARTAIKPVSSLPLSSEWPEMAALIRLDLPLSFDSRPHFYLPETLHIAISLCGAGPLAVRRSVHSFVVNTVHALAKDAESKTEILHKALVALGGSEGRSLFGIPGDSTATLPEWDVLKSGERLISILMEVVEAAAPSLDTANAWRARWTSLATAACFQHNPALQARQFLVLSFLGATSIDGDLVFQILTTLRSAIRLSPANDGQLAVVIIRTLVATLPGLLDDSPFWSGLGWLAIAFLQIGEPSITAAAIPLFSTVLTNMHRAGYFSQRPLVDTFLDYRDADGPDSSANALDDASGVDTEINLSFALATLLVNPLRDPETLESTVSLLFQLISLARHGAAPNGVNEDLGAIEEDAIPYFLLLLPTVARMGRLEELLLAVGLAVAEPAVEGFEQYRQAARHLGIHSRDNAHLSCALVVALAQSAHDAQERVALFAVLERLAVSHPDVAQTFFLPLSPLLNAALSSTASTDELAAAQALLQVLPSASSTGYPTADHILDHLNELGFPALAHVGVPLEEGEGITAEQLEISHLASQLLSNILQNPR